ncbi:uncharacterized protein LOC142606500 [Castanea sativa]|uniref:uncharacterized protein LOC142606500 n=1 Tax=Castanea sativa TaxID=21020 RepID=UPI003F6494D5
MIDQGSGANIMYPDLFKGLRLKLEDLAPYDSPLIRFKGKAVVPKGQIRLPVQFGSEMVEVDFIMVYAYSPYTAILARPWLHALGAVFSTLHVKVKFPSGEYIEEILGSQAVAKQCIFAAMLHQAETEKMNLLDFLKENIAVFVWDPYEAPGVDPSFICHHLNVNPAAVPRRQPPRRSSKEHSESVKEKLGKTIEIYVDDIVVKSKMISAHVKDLDDTFQVLRKYKLCLNASKCSFGVGSGKFLGYMVTHKGIEVNPVQVHLLSADRCRPFF